MKGDIVMMIICVANGLSVVEIVSCRYASDPDIESYYVNAAYYSFSPMHLR
jgi:hypothetical protein